MNEQSPDDEGAATPSEASDDLDDADRVLDAREIDGEPFGDIVAALEALGSGERLVLVNSFEPVPLYDVLESRGFAHETTQVADDEWHVEIADAEAA